MGRTLATKPLGKAVLKPMAAEVAGLERAALKPAAKLPAAKLPAAKMPIAKAAPKAAPKATMTRFPGVKGSVPPVPTGELPAVATGPKSALEAAAYAPTALAKPPRPSMVVKTKAPAGEVPVEAFAKAPKPRPAGMAVKEPAPVAGPVQATEAGTVGAVPSAVSKTPAQAAEAGTVGAVPSAVGKQPAQVVRGTPEAAQEAAAGARAKLPEPKMREIPPPPEGGGPAPGSTTPRVEVTPEAQEYLRRVEAATRPQRMAEQAIQNVERLAGSEIPILRELPAEEVKSVLSAFYGRPSGPLSARGMKALRELQLREGIILRNRYRMAGMDPDKLIGSKAFRQRLIRELGPEAGAREYERITSLLRQGRQMEKIIASEGLENALQAAAAGKLTPEQAKVIAEAAKTKKGKSAIERLLGRLMLAGGIGVGGLGIGAGMLASSAAQPTPYIPGQGRYVSPV